nr:uncharacterized protein LOC104115875 [Nicotiana tomentosiformis]
MEADTLSNLRSSTEMKGADSGYKVTKFLEGLNIKQIISSPYHPSVNGQAESSNKVIIQNLKKKLEDAKGHSADELPEALILVDIGEHTIRYSRTNEEENNEALLVKFELFEEHRNLAYAMMMKQKQMMERYYNRIANLRYFKAGDSVLRKLPLRFLNIQSRCLKILKQRTE